jgi:hypothetical protein
MNLVKKYAFTDKAIAQSRQDNICNTIIQVSNVKKTSNAKKVTVHKLESQINAYSNMIGDCSVNAKLKKEVYESSRKNARKKLKAK